MLISVGYGSRRQAVAEWHQWYQRHFELEHQLPPLRETTILSELQLNLMSPFLLLPVTNLLWVGQTLRDILREGKARCST